MPAMRMHDFVFKRNSSMCGSFLKNSSFSNTLQLVIHFGQQILAFFAAYRIDYTERETGPFGYENGSTQYCVELELC